MLRTALLLRRVTGARKHVLNANLRGPQDKNRLEKVQRRLREAEAERVFMQKIREDRRRRQRIIAKALRRALAKRAKEEFKFLRRYEANKAKAVEELRKMKETSEAPPAVVMTKVVETPGTMASSAKKTERQNKVAKQQRGEKEEREAEQRFFEMIEELRRKRESELAAAKQFNELIAAKIQSAKEVEVKEDMAFAVETNDGDAEVVSESSISVSKNKDKTDTLATQDVRESKPVTALKKDKKVVEEPNEMSVKETRDKSHVKATREEVTSPKALVMKQKPVKPREKRRKKPQIVEQTSVIHPVENQVADENFAQYAPSGIGYVPPPVFQRVPLHPVSLAGFNEPPMISSMGNTIDAGQRHLQALPSLEAPVLPLRPRTLDAFPPVARTVHTVPVSFPHNIPAVQPSRGQANPGAGLHRL